MVKWSVPVTPPASWRNCCRCCYWEKLQIISSAADFQLWPSSVAAVVRTRILCLVAVLASAGRRARGQGAAGVKWCRGAQHLQLPVRCGRSERGAGGAVISRYDHNCTKFPSLSHPATEISTSLLGFMLLIIALMSSCENLKLQSPEKSSRANRIFIFNVSG